MGQPEASRWKRFKTWFIEHITAFGLTVTVVWFVVYFRVYFVDIKLVDPSFIGAMPQKDFPSFLRNFYSMPLNEQGDFLAGFFAPLAFFWLIIGYFMQGYEISLQREEMTKQVDATEDNAKSAALNVFLIQSKDIHEEMQVAVQGIFGYIPKSYFLRIGNQFEHLRYFERIHQQLKHMYSDRSSQNNMDGTNSIDEFEQPINELGERNYVRIYCYLFSILLQKSYKADSTGQLTFHYQMSAAGRLNDFFLNTLGKATYFPKQIDKIVPEDKLQKILEDYNKTHITSERRN